jgi:hypothetical protein
MNMGAPKIGGWRRLASTAAVAAMVSLVAASTVLAGGNNGTLKIHELGTPPHFINNDPKVCVFNVEAYDLDVGQGGYLFFSVQGGDGPTGVDSGIWFVPSADASGYFETEYFFLQPGHYKATLYGKQLPSGELTDVKAKSKVFKVTCQASPE